ncbi:hypothetical protein D3C85_1618460 [compost metagenome]
MCDALRRALDLGFINAFLGNLVAHIVGTIDIELLLVHAKADGNGGGKDQHQ